METEPYRASQALRDAVLRGLVKRGRPVHFRAGQTIFGYGDPGTDLLVVQTGQVEISTVSISGRKVVLAHLGPGDLVGEVALLDQSPRSASASAVSDVTGHSLGFDDFRAFLLDHPDVHFALTVDLCAKLRSVNAVLEDQMQKDGATRLARAIQRLTEKFGTPDKKGSVIPMSLSQSDIGDLSGLTRANVNRYLRAWSDDGIVQFEKGTLRVVDLDRLSDLVDK